MKSVIAWPAPKAQGTASSHGSALGDEEVAATKVALGLNPEESFAMPADVLAHARLVKDRAAKVRKARIKIDLSIFEDWQAEDRESAADWVRTAIDDDEQERSILMQLQETGWSAPQSRAIYDLGRSR